MRKLFLFIMLLCIGFNLNAKPIATVNGVDIDSSLLEFSLKLNLDRGSQDDKALKDALVNELVMRELLAQEAVSLKLNKSESAKIKLKLGEQAILGQILIEDMLTKNPVTEKDLKDEYSKQSKELSGAEQYNLSVIVTDSREEAEAALNDLKEGKTFSDVAKKYSKDSSKTNGGELGWVLPAQVIGPVSNVMTNLNKGGLSKSPIATNVGWHLIKLNDTRRFVIPEFKAVKLALEKQIMQRRTQEYLKKVTEKAVIQR